MRRLLILASVAALALATMLATTASAAPARDDTFGGPTDIAGPAASTTWLFAEGTTRSGFDEFLLVLNTNPAPVDFTVTYLVDGGPPIVTAETIAGNSRRDIKVWQSIGREIDHGTRIDADAPIVVERAIYLEHSFDNVPAAVNGATSVFGQSETQPTWDFAEGTTLPGFQTYYLVSNPGDTDLTVNYTLAPENGTPVAASVAVPAKARRTIAALDVVGAGQVGIFGSFSSSGAFLAERAVYFDASVAGSPIANGGHANFGTLPANEWNLAEGNVLPGWYEFLTLGNPNPQPLTIALNYAFEGSPGTTKNVTVPGGGRTTVQVFDDNAATAGNAGGVGRNVSDPNSRGVSVQALAAGPFVIERPLYLTGLSVAGLEGVNDGTVTSGLPGRPSFSYVFAEGTTLSDFRSFFTFHNPNTTDAAAEVTYSTDAGEVVTRTLVVPAQSRITTQIFSADDAGKGALGLADRGFGAVIQSTNGVSINVERPIYEIHNFEGIGPVNGATDVVGRPGGSALSVAKSVAPATVTSGGQAVSTVTVNVFEADAHQLTVVDSVEVTPTEGTDAAFVPAASTVPAGFTCDGQTGAEVVCTATGDATPGTYTFGLAFTMTNQAGLGRPVATPVAVNDVVVVSALNTDTSSTTGAVTVNPAP